MYHFQEYKSQLHPLRLPNNQKYTCTTTAHYYTTIHHCSPSKITTYPRASSEYVQICIFYHLTSTFPHQTPRTFQLHSVQQTVCCLLFYALVIYFTMLVALGYLVLTQSNSTKQTVKALTKPFNYASTNPDTKITFQKNRMILYIDSNALYLSVSK